MLNLESSREFDFSYLFRFSNLFRFFNLFRLFNLFRFFTFLSKFVLVMKTEWELYPICQFLVPALKIFQISLHEENQWWSMHFFDLQSCLLWHYDHYKLCFLTLASMTSERAHQVWWGSWSPLSILALEPNSNKKSCSPERWHQ